MDTPAEPSGKQVGPGWRANDLTPADIARLLENFITKFEPGRPDECWLWRGTRLGNGYGGLGRSYRAALLAHRVAWVAFTGRPLTGNLTIDHLCNNKLCVNPDHLEPVTLHENIRRKNERLGYEIGAKSKTGKSGRRSPRPIADNAERAQRARQSSARYYAENRELVRARHRQSPVESAQEPCPECGKSIRHDGMRRHRRRIHGLSEAA